MTPAAAPTSWIDQTTARIILVTFLLTFMAARVTVLLIMLRWIPTLYLRVKSTHVHHLNYGIVLLSVAGAYVLLAHPTHGWLWTAAVVYSIGLGLTYDEFGMWLHLGGPYWQRASFDAVTVIGGILALLAFAPALDRLRVHHWTTAAVLVAVLVLFSVLLVRSLRYARQRISPVLQEIEARGPGE